MKKLSGFTLIEVLVVVAIVAILVRIAAPSFKKMLQSSAMKSAVNTFLVDVRYARSEAIRRGGSVVMCRSANPETASPVCGTGSSPAWESGWIIFHDLNNNADRAAGEDLLRQQSPISSIDSIGETGAPTKLVFTAAGRLKLTSITSIQFGGGNFANADQRIVCISVGGRARIAGDGNASC